MILKKMKYSPSANKGDLSRPDLSPRLYVVDPGLESKELTNKLQPVQSKGWTWVEGGVDGCPLGSWLHVTGLDPSLVTLVCLHVNGVKDRELGTTDENE